MRGRGLITDDKETPLNVISDWGAQQTVGLPRCLNCGHAVSIPGDRRHAAGQPPHHFWTEDEKCDPVDLKQAGYSGAHGEHPTVRYRHTD